jgi:hypothetical protein
VRRYALFASLCAAAWATGLRGDEGEGTAPLDEAPITDADRAHWAFRPLAEVEPPVVSDGAEAWVRNEIDRFVGARLDSQGRTPAPEADRAALLRRLTFDLTGLPPSPEEVEAFLAGASESAEPQDSDEAYEKVVDRLLASPEYGERWAQHWLDLARYAETDGFEHDNSRPEAWRYRDWVIAALNRDVPYDEFMALQVAGDELRPGDTDAAIATGFVLSGPDMPDLNLQEERRHMVLNEIAATTGAVFLGLQVGCAQCHEHKFDPISQADFYRLRALFEPAVVFKGEPRPDGVAPPIERRARVLRETGIAPAASYVLLRGDFRRRGPEVTPGFPRIANPWGDSVAPPAEGALSSGRRSGLARWLSRSDHLLTTRVIVNRLWQHHFGRGLVATPSDLGSMGAEPSDPALLDWLSRRLVAEGWSLKRMHRLILTSAAYRQTAPPRRLEGEVLRDAMLAVSGRLSRHRGGGPGVMPPLPKEVLATLRPDHWEVSPDEESHRRRSVYLFARRNLRYPLFEVFDRPDANLSCARRETSTTAPQALTLLNSELSLELARHFAGRLLREVAGAAAQGEAEGARALLVERAYRLALGRLPSAQELRAAIGFLEEQSQRVRGEGRPAEELALALGDEVAVGDPAAGAALTGFCLALFNLNEFVYVD